MPEYKNMLVSQYDSILRAASLPVTDKKITANKTKHEQLLDIPVNGKHLTTSKQITFHNDATSKETLPAPASSIQVQPAPRQKHKNCLLDCCRQVLPPKDCVTLKQSNKIVSGSLSEAVKQGKNDPSNVWQTDNKKAARLSLGLTHEKTQKIQKNREPRKRKQARAGFTQPHCGYSGALLFCCK